MAETTSGEISEIESNEGDLVYPVDARDVEWEQYEEVLANMLSFDQVRGTSVVSQFKKV